MRRELTQKQHETLRALVSLGKRNGITPTQRELVVVLGVTQNAVRARLRQLSLKGHIRLLPGLSRGIVIIGTTEGTC